MTVSHQRFAELKALFVRDIDDTVWFDEADWTGHIDAGNISEEELKWLNENTRVVATLVLNKSS